MNALALKFDLLSAVLYWLHKKFNLMYNVFFFRERGECVQVQR